MQSRRILSRRSILGLGSALLGRFGLAGLGLGSMPRRLAAAPAPEPGGTETHGLSSFGDLALPADFHAFSYVNLNAPKGGEIAMQISGISGNQNFTTFDTLNIFILKGDGAAGMTHDLRFADGRKCRRARCALWACRPESLDFRRQESLSLLLAQGSALP